MVVCYNCNGRGVVCLRFHDGDEAWARCRVCLGMGEVEPILEPDQITCQLAAEGRL